jgi:hypothetical protein
MSPAPPNPQRTTWLVADLWLAFALTFGLYAWTTSHEDQEQQLRTVAELSEKATDLYFLQLQRALGALSEQIVDNGRLRDLSEAQRCPSSRAATVPGCSCRWRCWRFSLR